MQSTLPPDLEDFVRDEVAAGRYAEADDVLASRRAIA
jgi:Arc/MetJ-type ribon-helix-helix transcriptional regulator